MRMPLSVGAGAALSLAIAMCGVGPIEWAVTWMLRIAVAAWTDGDLKSGLLYGGALAVFGWYGLSKWIPHVRAVWRRRPSDVVIDEAGLAISGGVHDGLKVAWADRLGLRELWANPACPWAK